MCRHEETCSVCLGEYEVNERVKWLPPCGHEFHEACIDLWFTNHTTCPMCRCSLLPPQVLPISQNKFLTSSSERHELTVTFVFISPIIINSRAAIPSLSTAIAGGCC